MKLLRSILTLAAAMAVCCCNKKDAAAEAKTLRVGYFPNLTHAQGLIGANDTKTKGANGYFEQKIGDVTIEWFAFNAGPPAMESLMAGNVDISYVGPNPALNTYTRNHGEEVRVLTGSARGGAALVVRAGSGLKNPADFKGKKVASPQLGGTQDIAARIWLKRGGLSITETGGDAKVLPVANAEQLDLLERGDIDAAWTVEPWVSRLEMEVKGERVLAQDDITTTLLVASVKALKEKRELVKKFAAAHKELTAKLNAEPDWAKKELNVAMAAATTRAMPTALLDHAWPRLKFTTDITPKDFEQIMNDGFDVGLLPEKADLTRLFSEQIKE